MLAAAIPAPQAQPLLTGEPMAKLVRTATALADIVLIAAPPVSQPETLALSAHVDGALLVARAHVTSKDSLQAAVRALVDMDAPVVAAVLTNRPRRPILRGHLPARRHARTDVPVAALPRRSRRRDSLRRSKRPKAEVGR
jgi:Mrp family chromosome partitioning ATPase